MVLSDLENMVWTWLDDLNGTYFTKAQIDVWLNNAQRETQKQLIQAGQNWYMTSAGTNLIANLDCYSLPLDLRIIHKVEILTQGTLTTPVSQQTRTRIVKKTPIESDMVDVGPAEPSAYYLKKNCIVFRAIPDLPYPCILTYSYMVQDMVASTAVPDVPIQYQEYVAILATIDGFLRDQRDPSSFMAKKGDYEALMRQDAAKRQVDGPRMVRETSSSFDCFF